MTGTFPAVTVTRTAATDVGDAYVFDFGQNMAGMVTLSLPAGHGIAAGTALRIEHGEVVQGKSRDTAGMCKLCPACKSCPTGGPGGGQSGPGGGGSCDTRGAGAVCDTYCKFHNASAAHPLRREPCYPHQSYTPGFPANGIKAHETPDRYIGDFNNANMTNVYIVRGATRASEPGAAADTGEVYTALFAAAGFRYAQV